MLIVKAPAKINWALSVLRKREDGYHDIISLIQTIDLYDTLIFEESEKIEIICNFPIKRENNLVYKATKAISEYKGIKKGVKITIQKEIPIGAGLAGGSSDAAATLKALNDFWKLNLSTEELIQLGKSLGSDVPFFFYPPIAMVEGKGEIISPLQIKKSYNLLLVKPSFNISTKWAYESLKIKTELTENYKKINNNIWQLYNILCEGFSNSIYLWNDLEKVVIGKYKEIELVKKRLLKVGAIVSLMSGSGSTVFGLFRNREETVAAAKNFNGYWVKIAQTLVS